MTLIEKVCCSLAAALWMAAAISCGEPAAPTAAFEQATAADLSPPKGGDPLGALPSHVVPGEVTAFIATSPDAGTPKNLDTAGSLPSNLSSGKGAVYAPRGRADSGDIPDAAGQDGEAATPRLRAPPHERAPRSTGSASNRFLHSSAQKQQGTPP